VWRGTKRAPSPVGIEAYDRLERLQRSVVHIGPCRADVAEGGDTKEPALRRVTRDRANSRVVTRNADTNGERRIKCRWAMTLEAAGLQRPKQTKATLLGKRERIAVPRRPLVIAGFLGREGPLERGQRASEMLQGDRGLDSGESPLKTFAIGGDRPQASEQGGRLRRHLVGREERPEDLNLQARRSTVPKEPLLETHVVQGRHVPTERPAWAAALRSSVPQRLLWPMAIGASDVPLRGEDAVEEEQPPKGCLLPSRSDTRERREWPVEAGGSGALPLDLRWCERTGEGERRADDAARERRYSPRTK